MATISTTRKANFRMGVCTPWSLDAVYKFDNKNRFYPWYHLLSDGLHSNWEVASRIAYQVAKDISEAHRLLLWPPASCRTRYPAIDDPAHIWLTRLP